MPALRNVKQERFCQYVKRGVPVWRAYPLAGYKPHISNGYRLSKSERVKRRLKELDKAMNQKTRVTVETLTAELDEAIALAKRVDQPGAITQAVTVKGKLHGLLIDRKETGQPGDFSAAQTAQEVIDAVRKELGEDAARALQALAGLSLVDQVAPVETSESGQGLDLELASPGDKIN